MSSSSNPHHHPLREEGFRYLEAELKLLMELFANVLRRMGEAELADCLPWVSDQTGPADKPLPTRTIAQAYSIAFQLLNIVEERAAARVRRTREKKGGPQAEKGLWADIITSMRRHGLSEDQLIEVLNEVEVEPVLTAHPTEAKRATVRELHREIYTLVNRHENDVLTPREKTRLQRHIEARLENLWRTGEIHVTRPTIEEELDNALYYLRDIFPETVKRTHVHLREAWTDAGMDAARLQEVSPMIRFGTWIGGDRDGHPFVTAEVTAHSLRSLRQSALRVQRRGLESLAEELPVSSLFQQAPAALIALIERLNADLRESPVVDLESVAQRNNEEPWRHAIYLMRAKVLSALKDLPAPASYRSPDELAADLEVVATTLDEIGARRLTADTVWPLRRTVQTFGFHLATLDVRQNSSFHEKALDQLLRKAGLITGEPFGTWSQERKRALLDEELKSPRPFLGAGVSAGPEADTVLACHRVLAAHRAQNGEAGLGALIVSMTRNTEDLLTVYLLAREAGLAEWSDDGLVCPLPVTPLLETMGDLELGPEIVNDFLAHPVTQRSLAYCAKGGEPQMQMMVGYSDSNKDCGIFASQWALHRAQKALAEVTLKHGTKPVFFHGRGGTVGRGAGPTNWFMQALAHGSLTGRMRMTEQGETIAQKYAHQASAVYNVELLMASAAHTTARHRFDEVPEETLWPLLDQLSAYSRDAYRAFLHTPDFIKFYRQATPIDALENARIGSRPSRRTGQATIDDLRAIPWVFSWTQNRFYLPGWYGSGSALEKLKTENPAGFEQVCAGAQRSPFLRYVLTNIESSLVSANTGIMNDYAGLVEDEAVRERFMALVHGEFERTRRMMEEVFKGTFAERRPRLAYTLEIREQALAELHRQQVALLREWRSLEGAAAEAKMPDMLLTINALASGLRTTG